MEPSDYRILWIIPLSGVSFVLSFRLGIWLVEGGLSDLYCQIKQAFSSRKKAKPEQEFQTQTKPWNENTDSNPFWESATPVEVDLVSGGIRKLYRPILFKNTMKCVKRWREIGDATQAPSHPS